MHQKMLVTGFLEFGGFQVNPSALLARSCGARFELLEVSFAAVDGFLDRLEFAGSPFDHLLMLGLRGQGTAIDLEQVARNHVGAAPDVRGVVRGPGPVDPDGPDTLRSTMFTAAPLAAGSPSTDAGGYLCNYIYYRALRRFPGKRVGFVHVPPLEVLPLDDQRRELALLLDAVAGS